eukprot:CAMPEP_0206006638 /NCGR_PEP_ID=MMETSP1464-20131121/5297_1 /ASSEMBLY_ACC=CAM_ASM_001124 /TAXON_ID=119497 /ORGANISM="Exanthemachrysis gayraliae, Strain RCC1523" /LENGTH=119 /DNA_ID=CAMNT_0053380119 /DNA_START=283 /DNA_END=639 /DNA_ORIENTATION=-
MSARYGDLFVNGTEGSPSRTRPPRALRGHRDDLTAEPSPEAGTGAAAATDDPATPHVRSGRGAASDDMECSSIARLSNQRVYCPQRGAIFRQRATVWTQMRGDATRVAPGGSHRAQNSE